MLYEHISEYDQTFDPKVAIGHMYSDLISLFSDFIL